MNPLYNSRAQSLYKGFSEHAVAARQREMTQLQEQMSSGRRINRPSDDPGGWAQARRLEAITGQLDQYTRSLSAARGWSDATQSSLAELAELYTQAYEEGIRHTNGVYTDADRGSAASRLRSVRTAILEGMNTRHNGEYLFAGAASTVRPFEDTGAGVTYQGDARGRERHVGPDLQLRLNTTGADLLAPLSDDDGPFTMIEALDEMITALETNDPALSDKLGRVMAARDHVIGLGAEAGNVGNRLNLAEAQIQESQLLIEQRRSQTEDTDFAEALTEFQRAQTGLQAAYQATASVLKTSILDYL